MSTYPSISAHGRSRALLPITLAFIGAFSSLVTTIWLAHSRLSVFVGSVFGVAVVCGLTAFGVLRGPLRAGALVFAAVFALYGAYFVSFITQLALSGLGLLTKEEEWSMGHRAAASPVALLAGGVAGGFLLVAAVLTAVTPDGTVRTVLRRAFWWSAMSGALAVAGWALSPLLGPGLSHALGILRPREAWLPQTDIQGGPLGMVCAVHFVWQTGMAFAIGLMVQTRHPVSDQKGVQS